MESQAIRYRFRHLSELDGLRGIAVLMVFCHHALFTSIETEHWPVYLQRLREISRYGANGVDIFFVLSGFLITSLLFSDRERPSYLHNFYWKRVLRIVPLFVITLLLVAVINPAARSYVVLSLLFIVNYANLFHVSAFEGPFWTLAIEEQFYLIWPQLARRVSVQRLQSIAIALCVAVTALRVLSNLSNHHNFFQTQFRADGLALGAVLACQTYLHNLQSAETDRLAWWRKTYLRITVPAAVLLVATIAGKHLGIIDGYTSAGMTISATILLSYSVIAYAISHPMSRILAPLRSPVFRFFGLISYCFYLVHLYLLRLYDHWAGAVSIGNVPALALRAAVVLLAAVSLCLVARYLVELPAQKLRRFVLRSDEVVPVREEIRLPVRAHAYEDELTVDSALDRVLPLLALGGQLETLPTGERAAHNQA